MSVKERSLKKIEKTILHFHQLERGGRGGTRRYWYGLRRFISMVHYEWVKNDVMIRAESLSYYTLFSFMPLMAGIFLLLGIFSQWGPVQKGFETLLARFLDAIPGEQKKVLLSFILQFRDQYLENLTRKSGSIGVFALGVLVWIGAKVFFNIESLMNRIWAVKENRPFFERVKNFFFCMILLPFVYAATISVPRLIEHFGGKNANLFLDQGLFVLIVFLSLSVVLKFFPNTRVSWKSAYAGALASTLGFGAANFLLRYYFKMGTETAYGKAAVLPIFAYFIYVSWMIFIIGIEISLLTEKGGEMLRKKFPETTLAQSLLLEKLVHLLRHQFEQGKGPITVEEMSKKLDARILVVEAVLEFLTRRGAVSKVELRSGESAEAYALAQAITDDDLLLIIKDFLNLTRLSQSFDVFGLISRLKRS
jgi:membrane protein